VISPMETTRMLERPGCCATNASGMLEGMHAPRATQFDLGLMDTHMPGIRGADHASAEMRSTPTIVALAEYGPQADAKRFRELGFDDDSLFKPFRPRQLRAMPGKHVRARAPMSDIGGNGGGGVRPPSAGADVLDREALARLRELDPHGESKLIERVLKA